MFLKITLKITLKISLKITLRITLKIFWGAPVRRPLDDYD